MRPLSVHFAAAQSAKLALVGCAHCGARHTVQRMAAQIEMRHILEQKLAEFENLHILDGVSRRQTFAHLCVCLQATHPCSKSVFVWSLLPLVAT
jgi:hypothetical protein